MACYACLTFIFLYHKKSSLGICMASKKDKTTYKMEDAKKIIEFPEEVLKSD